MRGPMCLRVRRRDPRLRVRRARNELRCALGTRIFRAWTSDRCTPTRRRRLPAACRPRPISSGSSGTSLSWTTSFSPSICCLLFQKRNEHILISFFNHKIASYKIGNNLKVGSNYLWTGWNAYLNREAGFIIGGSSVSRLVGMEIVTYTKMFCFLFAHFFCYVIFNFWPFCVQNAYRYNEL